MEVRMKPVLVTGGGRGLGRGVAERLAASGHRVLLTSRNAEEGERAVHEIRREHASVSVEWALLDLASNASIRAFVRELPSHRHFDVVMHVAGVLQQSPTRRMTVDGIEETLAVNALAPFLLTHELRNRIGSPRGPGRVVCVSSQLHRPGSRGPEVHFDFEDPNLEHGYDPDVAYKNSKLAMLWFAFELARRTPRSRFTVHGMCPGFVPETAAHSVHGMRRLLMRYLLPHLPFATRARDAVVAMEYVAVEPELDHSTAGFWVNRELALASRDARDAELGKRFWRWAEQATGAVWLLPDRPQFAER